MPTFSTVGPWAYTDGDYAIGMFGDYGVRFYESQELEFKTYLARNEDGSYSALTICVSKPRQNGKSYAARFYALWMAAIEGKNVLYSAHNGDTVRKMFKALRSFVEHNEDFACLLRPNGQGIYAAKGSEGIYFVDEDGNDGGCIEFQTRTNGKARGTTYHILIIDEAQELTDEHLEAIQPTTFAASDVAEADSDPQMIYLGTPPNEKCPGTVFRDFHDKAHADPDTSIWWMEWAVEKLPCKCNRDELMELVYLTNPAMGYRIKEKTMRNAMDTMKIDSFARECLGWWTSVRRATVDHPVQTKDWNACAIADEDAPDYEHQVFAVKFSPDNARGALAVCSFGEEGKPHVELVQVASLAHGVGWFVDYVLDVESFAASVVIDGRGVAQTLVDRLADAGMDVEDSDVLHLPTTSEVMSWVSSFVDATQSHTLTHLEDPALSDSVCGCKRRRIGKAGGFGFESTEDSDATAAEAAALAYGRAMALRREGMAQTELRMG